MSSCQDLDWHKVCTSLIQRVIPLPPPPSHISSPRGYLQNINCIAGVCVFRCVFVCGGGWRYKCSVYDLGLEVTRGRLWKPTVGLFLRQSGSSWWPWIRSLDMLLIQNTFLFPLLCTFNSSVGQQQFQKETLYTSRCFHSYRSDWDWFSECCRVCINGGEGKSVFSCWMSGGAVLCCNILPSQNSACVTDVAHPRFCQVPNAWIPAS